ncbi:MAG: M50 family metallopeptidase [Chloroflexota bacterium]
MWLTIVSFLAVLFILVLVHELGHFLTARLFHVKVEEFGLGFPPRLWGIKRGGTIYSLNAVPFGGFVKLAGEEDPSVSGSLASKPAGVRITVLSAGVIMNALLPILLFSIAFLVPHNVVSGDVVVQDVAPQSPAGQAGIVAGERIISIDGRTVRNISDLQRAIQLKLGQKIDIILQKDNGAVTTVSVVPRWRTPTNQGATGIMVGLENPALVRESFPFWRAIPMGVGECLETFVLFKNVIISMIIGAAPLVIAGPVGVAQLTGEVARAGIGPLLEFAAFFSINLAIINFFPLPALDGGRIAFVVLEWLRRGKRVSPRVEGMIHTIGFFLLLTAMLLFTYQDIARIMAGESLIP